MKNRAFTLIELLVVVLIIGILASIAVPQYQVAVAKAKYSTLKAKTRALAESINRYVLATGKEPQTKNDLDLSFDNVGDCTFLDKANGGAAACFLNDRKMGFYFSWETLTPIICYAKKDYAAGLKVCAQETGKAACAASWCTSGDYRLFYY